ncbi:UNVERIFIED_CONTAM: hypothetical protein RMT77_018065 [Armadillidium vulgare]
MRSNWPLSLALLCVLIGCSLGTNKPDAKLGKIFFKDYSTKTKVLLSFLTSTVPFTCYTVADMLPSCTGRRKRNLHLPTDIDLGDLTSKEELSSGLDDSQQTDTDSPLKSGKFKLTIWSTVSSTLTITTFAVNQLITLSVSAQCTVGGVILPLC